VSLLAQPLQRQEFKIQNSKFKITMARIAGVDLPKTKRGEIGLTYIFGIGLSTAKYILGKAGIDVNKKVNQWNDDELTAIRNIITNEFKVEGQLRSEVQTSIKRLLDIACYRGLRHRKGLPVRGQRTRTNSRTRKGKRKTVAGKKKVAKK
jgi:small subunit ribosomal protein S13